MQLEFFDCTPKDGTIIIAFGAHDYKDKMIPENFLMKSLVQEDNKKWFDSEDDPWGCNMDTITTFINLGISDWESLDSFARNNTPGQLRDIFTIFDDAPKNGEILIVLALNKDGSSETLFMKWKSEENYWEDLYGDYPKDPDEYIDYKMTHFISTSCYSNQELFKMAPLEITPGKIKKTLVQLEL